MHFASLSRIGFAEKSLLVLMGGLIWTGDARAQTAAGQQSDSSVEEIIVTAQRRREDIQDVPISIVAFSAERLKELNVSKTSDLVHVTPGLMIPVDAIYVKPRLRGVGTVAASPSIEPPVAIYIDGVYIASAAGSTFSLNNIVNIEIDKGPQGTLFGRNATGGLIQITTRDPRQDFGWSGSVSYANYDTVSGDLYVTGGVAPNLAADLAVSGSYQGDGYGTNLFNGDKMNFTREYSARTKWLFTPSDATSVKLGLDYRRMDGSPQLIPAPGSTPAGGVPYTGPRQGMNALYTPDSKVESIGASLTLDHEFGFANFKSISAFRQNKMDLRYNSLTTDPATTTLADITDRSEQFSQEFQIQSKDSDDLKWTAGAFFFTARARYDPIKYVMPGLDPFTYFAAASSERTYSGALYAQGTKEILPDTNLTLGLRYTAERRRATSTQFLGDPPFELGADRGSRSVGRVTWRASIDHRFSPDFMVYASYNRGFKSGGFNMGTVPLLGFSPETLDAYEVGFKSSAFDNRVKFNAAAFYYDYKNIQAVMFELGSAGIYNGEGAEIYGVDIDISARLTDQLSITLGGEFIESSYKDFPNAALSIPLPGGGVIYDVGNAKGRQLAEAPNNYVTASVNYDVPASFGTFTLSANYSYVGRWYGEPDHRLSQKAYEVVGGQVSFAPTDEAWVVRLWGRNLFDEEYVILTGSQGSGDFATYAPPRTYGVTFEKPF
jgi:iron complex outermembrane recepter protein